MTKDNWITLYAVTIEFVDLWAIGGIAELAADIKIPIVKDPRVTGDAEKPVLPGASIAGSLRAVSTAMLGRERTERLFGHVTPDVLEADGKTKSTAVQASKVEILGAELQGEYDGLVLENTRTMVDIAAGAAATGSLRNEQVVRPATYRILIQITGGPDAPAVREWQRVVKNWVPQLGRGRSYGLARGQVKLIEWVSANLDSPAGLKWWLTEKTAFFDGTGATAAIDGELATGEDKSEANVPRPEYKVAFEVREPIHIGTQVDEKESNIPIFKVGGRPIIPGSSWKGVFRHRAAMILNAVGEQELSGQVVELLFGSASRGRGILWFRTSTFTPIDKAAEVTTAWREHVAIDRFSGGAKDTAKFSWECVPRGNKVVLEIIAPGVSADTELGNLLVHILWDIHDGLIGIGGGISRGYGQLRLSGWAGSPPRSIDIKQLKNEVEALQSGGEVA